MYKSFSFTGKMKISNYRVSYLFNTIDTNIVYMVKVIFWAAMQHFYRSNLGLPFKTMECVDTRIAVALRYTNYFTKKKLLIVVKGIVDGPNRFNNVSLITA